MKRKWFINFWVSSVYLFNAHNITAQNTSLWQFKAEQGFLIQHSQDIAPIGSAQPLGLGLDWSVLLDPAKHYANCLCLPRLGLSVNYHYLDKPGILGMALPVYGFFEPHYKLGSRTAFFLRGGMGLAYQSSPYDVESNPLNLSYSLYINTFIQLGLGFEYRLSDKWRANLAFMYNHTSNGGLQEPNKGLNYPTWQIGGSYSPKGIPNIETQLLRKARPESRKHFEIQAFFAGKAIDNSRVTYLISGLELGYLHQLNRISAFDVGLEGVWHGANRQRIALLPEKQLHQQLNLLLGHAFTLGKFVFSQQAGIYVYRDFNNTPDWFQRYGLHYYVWGPLSIGTNIRVHGHVAEFLDFRVGFSL